MDNICILKLLYEYASTGKRNIGQSRKRWRHQNPWRQNIHEMAYALLLIEWTDINRNDIHVTTVNVDTNTKFHRNSLSSFVDEQIWG
jgi:hypothetical protein